MVARVWSSWPCACQRRKKEEEENVTPFWEHEAAKKGQEVEEEEETSILGFEQASHLKEQGNEALGRGDISQANEHWLQALDVLSCPPPVEGEESSHLPQRPNSDTDDEKDEDPKLTELRVSLLLNLSLGHMKTNKWRQAVSYCDEALVEQPQNAKALYRKAEALYELSDLTECKQVLSLLEQTGEDGKRLATQKRRAWHKSLKATDGKERKMWAAAISDRTKAEQVAAEEAAAKAAAEEAAAKAAAAEKAARAAAPPRWVPPKVQPMSVFDLRGKGLVWEENEDFSDAVWREGLGRRDAAFYYKKALPLTLLAASALSETAIEGEFVIHCFLDGNMAPFAEPHDWGAFLKRCPNVKILTVVYIDIGAVPKNADGSEAQTMMPYGTLLRPTEEGRIGDRVARAARFLGTYQEFLNHCVGLPGLVTPNLALWADVPLYGTGEGDLAGRLDAFTLLGKKNVPSVVTFGSEVAEPGGPQFVPKTDDGTNLSLGVLDLGLGAASFKATTAWQWNRFVVPLDRGERGIIAAHAILGVMRIRRSVAPKASAVVKILKDRQVTVAAQQMQKPAPQPKENELIQKQWAAFMKKMEAEGRPTGSDLSEEERNRQAMEFYRFCGSPGEESPPFRR